MDGSCRLYTRGGVVAEVVEETCTLSFFFSNVLAVRCAAFFVVSGSEEEERRCRHLHSECCFVGRAGTGTVCLLQNFVDMLQAHFNKRIPKYVPIHFHD